MKSEWEKLPEETKKEVHDAFVKGYADHGTEQVERFLLGIGDERKRVEAYKHFIKNWLDYLVYTEDINEKDDIVESLQKAKEDESEEVREAAEEALNKYYGR